MSLYHSLAIFDDGHWSVAFGDYDKAVVIAERDDYKTHYKAKHLKVFSTVASEGQAPIDAVIADCNYAAYAFAM